MERWGRGSSASNVSVRYYYGGSSSLYAGNQAPGSGDVDGAVGLLGVVKLLIIACTGPKFNRIVPHQPTQVPGYFLGRLGLGREHNREYREHDLEKYNLSSISSFQLPHCHKAFCSEEQRYKCTGKCRRCCSSCTVKREEGQNCNPISINRTPHSYIYV